MVYFIRNLKDVKSELKTSKPNIEKVIKVINTRLNNRRYFHNFKRVSNFDSSDSSEALRTYNGQISGYVKSLNDSLGLIGEKRYKEASDNVQKALKHLDSLREWIDGLCDVLD